MGKNKIQDERMKLYFKDAAKDLIRAEGLAVISARNVAERAGYSYATLYNYFKDIRDLIYNCSVDFLDECREYINNETASLESGEKKLRASVKSYIKFFVQYPGIYDLIYFQNIKNIATVNSDLKEISDFLFSILKDDLQKMNMNKNEEVLLLYALHGLFAMNFSRRTELNYQDLIEKSDSIISVFLKK